MKHTLLLTCIVFLFSCTKTEPTSNTYYVNSASGNDTNDGLSAETAWKSLEKASSRTYQTGEELLLCEGCTFYGKLDLKGDGTTDAPVVVSAYNPGSGKSSRPVINAKGYVAGIQIKNGKNFKVSDIEIVADAGEIKEPDAKTKRYGVWLTADQAGIYSNISFDNLFIHQIFATENIKKDGANSTSNLGYGIFVQMQKTSAKIKNVKIENCTIEMTGHTGIRISGAGGANDRSFLDSVTIVNNRLKHIGGPGMVPGRCENVLVRGNIVDHSGSSIDPRMHARGSGIWPWTCNNVLIEKNKFMHARGKADSCGAHIDFNCNNVVVQYNLSMDNAGGFVEILGNDRNCCYRYNISINDGFRIKGEDGAHQEGKVLWTSGYVGSGNQKHGPYNSYIYNNTIYVKEEIRSCFSFARTTEGILIANNIFHILGETFDVSGDQDTQAEDQSLTIENVVFKNNVYQNSGILPESLIIKDSNPFVGDAGFKNAGGIEPEDYIPSSVSLLQDKGIAWQKIPGDEPGLLMDLEVEEDYFGNPIIGLPDIGAVELQ